MKDRIELVVAFRVEYDTPEQRVKTISALRKSLLRLSSTGAKPLWTSKPLGKVALTKAMRDEGDPAEFKWRVRRNVAGEKRSKWTEWSVDKGTRQQVKDIALDYAELLWNHDNVDLQIKKVGDGDVAEALLKVLAETGPFRDL